MGKINVRIECDEEKWLKHRARLVGFGLTVQEWFNGVLNQTVGPQELPADGKPERVSNVAPEAGMPVRNLPQDQAQRHEQRKAEAFDPLDIPGVKRVSEVVPVTDWAAEKALREAFKAFMDQDRLETSREEKQAVVAAEVERRAAIGEPYTEAEDYRLRKWARGE